jgi:hypothetical protein
VRDTQIGVQRNQADDYHSSRNQREVPHEFTIDQCSHDQADCEHAVANKAILDGEKQHSGHREQHRWHQLPTKRGTGLFGRN